MAPETLHFLESMLLDNDPVVSPEHARMVMESYLAADIFAETGDPVDLPLSNPDNRFQRLALPNVSAGSFSVAA